MTTAFGWGPGRARYATVVPRPRGAARVLGGLGGLAIVAASAPPASALAADGEVTSDTSAQFYEVRSPTGEVLVARRRLVSTLGAAAYDLLGTRDGGPSRRPGPELTFRARLRYEGDFGIGGAETNPTNTSRFVPGLVATPVDLMYGYVEGRRFLDGWLGFRLGRQYVTDVLGWYAFDGGSVRVTTPAFVAVEAYGGLEVRGGMPLSTSRFEGDGIVRGSRDGLDAALYPAFQASSPAPVVGVAVETTGISWGHARLTYRRVENTGPSTLALFDGALAALGPATPGSVRALAPGGLDRARVSAEKLGASADAEWAGVAGARASVAYDLYTARVSNVSASVDAFPTRRLTVGLDYDYYRPTFDADSIWSAFAIEPMNDLGARGNLDLTDALAISASAHVRAFGQETGPEGTPARDTAPAPNANYYPSNGLAFNEGGDVAARYRGNEGQVRLRGSGQAGDGGDRVGADVFGERILETRYVLQGRASLWQWDDKLRPERSVASVGYVAGLGYRFAPRCEALAEWEHTMNRLVGQRLRLMVWLSVAVAR